MGTPWVATAISWGMSLLCVVLSTIIFPRILSIAFDASEKVQNLPIQAILQVKKAQRGIEEQRMLKEAEGENSAVTILDTLAGRLRHALYEAEDILDLVDYHRIDREVNGGTMDICTTFCKESWSGILRFFRSRSAQLRQWAARNSSLRKVLCKLDDDILPRTSDAETSGDPVLLSTDEPASLVTNVSPSDTSGGWQEKVSVSVVPLTSRWNLKRRIKNIEKTISEVENSPLYEISKTEQKDKFSQHRSNIRKDSEQKVFGREVFLKRIMEKFGETPDGDTPSSSSSQCFSVIGIYGIAGSGKTTFARYVQQCLQEEVVNKKFDIIMCIHVSETFSLEDIFHDMLEDITKNRHSNISSCRVLKVKLKEELRDKRFLLILDDLWEKNNSNEEQKDILSPLNVGMQGSIVMLTAREKSAVTALGASEPIEIPDLHEEQYFRMFMHYALDSTDVPDEEYTQQGRKIAQRLQGSPIAAAVVGGQLLRQPIEFWRATAERDVLNKTRGALWWSYLQLGEDIRRCFEYCNIFPRRFKLKRDELAHLWIAQGFIKTSRATGEMEDVAEGYVQKLVSCAFLQPEGTSADTDYLTVHDLLRDIANTVSGSDFSIIENARSKIGDGPLSREKREGWKDVRHLFLQNYDEKWITKILELEHLRSLIIYNVGGFVAVEDKVIKSISKRLPKLRVLAIALSQEKEELIREPRELPVPESVSQLKYLRYLAIRARAECCLTLPSSLAKLYHMQVLDIGSFVRLDLPPAYLINLRHVFCSPGMKFPHIGRLILLQTIPYFTVRNEQGYEIKQMKDLNKLRGTLFLAGLENVKSKEKAVEANLASKGVHLTGLELSWGNSDTRCSEEIEAQVLEGLCPPRELKSLTISNYKGTSYPDWMVGQMNHGPEYLHKLSFKACSQLGHAPELKAFPHLRSLDLRGCSWRTLPENMMNHAFLKILLIEKCMNIHSLPMLPRSLQVFILIHCNDDFMKSCQIGGSERQKIEHVRDIHIHMTPGVQATLDSKTMGTWRDEIRSDNHRRGKSGPQVMLLSEMLAILERNFSHSY